MYPMYSGSRYLVGPAVGFPHGKTTTKHQVGCPIRRSEDQSPFPAPLCLSQGITSFIASCCQGIHQTPFSRLIRSRDGQVIKAGLLHARPSPSSTPHGAAPIGSHTFPAPWPGKATEHSVSVLDLEQNRRRGSVSRRPRSPPHSEEPAVLMFLFLHNVNTSSNRTAQRHKGAQRSNRRNGGACRDRTDDPLLAKQVLSQLS